MDTKFYHQSEGLAMGAPSSALLAEIYLQLLEHNQILHLLLKHKVISYHRYVDDILITYDTSNTNINDTLSDFNNLHHKLHFTIENELNNQINFLDPTILRHHNNLQFGIYRRKTTTDIMIHNDSCHPTEHKMSGINYLINRIITYHITNSNLNLESQIINHLLKSNGYKHLKTEDLIQKKEKHAQKENINQTHRKWANFTYVGKETKLITKLFREHNIGIVFRTKNTIEKLLNRENKIYNKFEQCGIYEVKCNSCPKVYIGQTGRNFKTRS
jgi:hypothetical protein